MDARRLAGWYREAVRRHRSGRLDKARRLYERVLEHEPDHAAALHGLGVLLHDQGEPASAEALLRAAIARRPEAPAYPNSLGNTLRALGRAKEAEAAYREALERDPAYALASHNLGALLQERGRIDEARAAFETALQLDASLAAAALALASLHTHEGRLAEAETCLRRALERSPDQPDALFELATLLRRQGRLDEAIACLARTVSLRPHAAAAYVNLGALHQLRGRVEEALACFDRALEVAPRSAEAHFNRGKLLGDLARFEEARIDYEAALQSGSDLDVEVRCHLAVVRRHLCDWEDEEEHTTELVRRIEAYLRSGSARGLPPLTLNVVKVPAALRLVVARHLARGLERQTASARASCAFRYAPRRDPSRLRIGYVSPDFRTHAVGTLVHGLFRHHDRDAVSVHAYSLVDVDDAFQRSVRAGVDAFVDVSQDTPEAIARRIHADGIDVLVDLAGYTTYSRTALFALRPAPVQAHWLGYLDTMGADFLPYVIADDRVIPEPAAADFSETLVSLPGGFAVASELPIDEAPLRRADEGLPERAFVFCCMNALHKLDGESFDAWMRILARVPESVLWLYGETSESGRSNLAREATRRGVDPARILYAPRAPLPRYLARYRLADLFLDTFAYNAGATAVGALRAGLPVLTKPGDTFMARMGASLCAAAGIPEMICEDLRAYEERAVSLATDPEALASVRRRLAEGHRAAPLFDPRRCARELEAAYRVMWRHHAEEASTRRIRAESPG